MKETKIYALISKDGREYVAHMPRREIGMRLMAQIREELSKARYQELRAQGVPSWGETETRRKMGVSA